MIINQNVTVDFLVENGDSNKIEPCQCRKKVLKQRMNTCKWNVSLLIKGRTVSAAGSPSPAYSYEYEAFAIKTLTPTTTPQAISTASCEMNEKPMVGRFGLVLLK